MQALECSPLQRSLPCRFRNGFSRWRELRDCRGLDPQIDDAQTGVFWSWKLGPCLVLGSSLLKWAPKFTLRLCSPQSQRERETELGPPFALEHLSSHRPCSALTAEPWASQPRVSLKMGVYREPDLKPKYPGLLLFPDLLKGQLLFRPAPRDCRGATKNQRFVYLCFVIVPRLLPW